MTCDGDLRGACLYILIVTNSVVKANEAIARLKKMRYDVWGRLVEKAITRATMRNAIGIRAHGNNGLIPVNISFAIFTFFIVSIISHCVKMIHYQIAS